MTSINYKIYLFQNQESLHFSDTVYNGSRMTFRVNNGYSPTQLGSSTSHSKTRIPGWSYSNANFALKQLAHSGPARYSTAIALERTWLISL